MGAGQGVRCALGLCYAQDASLCLCRALCPFGGASLCLSLGLFVTCHGCCADPTGSEVSSSVGLAPFAGCTALFLRGCRVGRPGWEVPEGTLIPRNSRYGLPLVAPPKGPVALLDLPWGLVPGNEDWWRVDWSWL